MKAAIVTPGRDAGEIIKFLNALDPSFKPEIWPDIENPEEIEIALVWRASDQVMAQFTNLKLICSFGAGVDHILFNSGISSSVRISRLVDPLLTQNVVKYCLMSVFAYEKSFKDHILNIKKKKWGWKEDNQVSAIGLVGMGVIGSEIAMKLKDLGYKVNGYSKTPKSIPGITHYQGSENLDKFLKDSDVLVNILPLTDQTRFFFKKDFWQRCKPGTYFINLGRGQHVKDEDLLEAIESGLLSGATLDVFSEEPLPADHPFWNCGQITITPHIAGLTLPKSAAIQFHENYKRLRNNEPILNLVDRKKGY